MRYRAVVFDLDGTLLDTIEDITIALNRAFERRGFPALSIPACKSLVGEGMDTLVRKALTGHPCDEAFIREFILDFRREYEFVWRDHSRLYPGILDLLEELGRRGIGKAVLSNKSHRATVAMIRELIPHEFSVVRGAMPEVPLKPDPASALLIASEMGLPPESFVFLGDSNIDIKTAHAAGMFAAGAAWGFRGERELIESGADAVAANPADLLPLFG